MASSKTIRDNLIDAVKAVNPSIDTDKGPVFDLLLRPVPDEIASVSGDISALSTLYSPLIATDSNNTQAIDTLGEAFKVSKPAGQRARCGLVFWFTALPTTTINIPAGTAVSTVDKSIIYTTTSDIRGINAQTAFAYYNSSTGRYEVFVDAVASQEGAAYEVPAYRLTLLLSTVSGISGVYNPTQGQGGVDAGSYSTYLSLIQKRFRGRVASSFASYEELALELYPDIVTGFIPSSDTSGFRRSVRGDGFDCVVAVPYSLTAEETFQASQATPGSEPGTLVFELLHQPCLGVNAVYVNGSYVSNYEFLQDTDPATQYSARGHDRVLIKQTLKVTDTVRVNFNYCGYCYGLQGQLFNTNTDDFFGSDGLVRLAEPAGVVVEMDVQLVMQTSGFQSSIVAFILGYINGLGFTSNLSPEQFITDLYATYTEIRSVKLKQFHREGNYTNQVDVIDFLGFETPSITAANCTVKVT